MSTDRRAWLVQLAAALALSVGLVAFLDLVTNSLDIARFSWDFRYYIRMASDPIAGPYASPFAYRYLTPLIVHGITSLTQISLEGGFRTVAYAGALLQLLSVFALVLWYTRSLRGAYVAILVTALSLYNVKFLLFDIYRPDHLAYGLIVLQTFLAWKRRFVALLICTIVAVQVREFNALPLIAYVVSVEISAKRSDSNLSTSRLLSEGLISAGALIAAMGIPRYLIPVSQDFQFVSLTRDGILRALLAPLVLVRDLNFLFSILAYALPTLLLILLAGAWDRLEGIGTFERSYLLVYSVGVLLLSFFGGTDFYRFSSFLFLPQAIVIALLAAKTSLPVLGIVLVTVAAFNRIWLPFPTTDSGAYLDFYGAFGTRQSGATNARWIELLSLLGAGGILGILRCRRIRASKPRMSG